MSVYKRDGCQTYSYDFRWRGHRFSGSTLCTTEREAKVFEKAERRRVEAETIDHRKPLNFGAASSLWWQEVAQHLKNRVDLERYLAWLQKHIGMKTTLSAITDTTVARLVSKRRTDGVSNATVNRSVIEPLRAILRRSQRTWKQRTAEIEWKDHALKEAQERVRELTAEEELRYFAALRPDYHPIIRFALLSGCRMQEMLDLKWTAIDWRNKSIKVTGKGDKTAMIPLSASLEALLKPLPRTSDKHNVFTYVRRSARDGDRGSNATIQREGLKITHKRTCIKAGIDDFRFHDFRHTAATRLLRETGNLKLVQRLLRHEDIKTTTKYAHSTFEDLMAAMNATDFATTAANDVEKALKIRGDKN